MLGGLSVLLLIAMGVVLAWFLCRTVGRDWASPSRGRAPLVAGVLLAAFGFGAACSLLWGVALVVAGHEPESFVSKLGGLWQLTLVLSLSLSAVTAVGRSAQAWQKRTLWPTLEAALHIGVLVATIAILPQLYSEGRFLLGAGGEGLGAVITGGLSTGLLWAALLVRHYAARAAEQADQKAEASSAATSRAAEVGQLGEDGMLLAVPADHRA